MECNRHKANGAMVISVTGRMDAVTARDFEKESGAWTGEEEKKLVVDLSGVDYISSAGLRSFLLLGKRVKAAGGTLALSGMQGMVRDVFDMSGFATIFPVYATIEEAVEAA
jgi:anti-anti-sigma factor